MKAQFKSILFNTVFAVTMAPAAYSSEAVVCPAAIPVDVINSTPQISGVVYNKPKMFNNLEIALNGANFEVIWVRVSQTEDSGKVLLANQGDTLGQIMTHNSLVSVPLNKTTQYTCKYLRTDVYHINKPIEIEIELKRK